MTARRHHAPRSPLASPLRRLGWLVALLEPALIVAMGVLVLFVVLSILVPIVSLNQLVR